MHPDASPDITRFRAVLLDLDGTIAYEEHALPGAVELVSRLQKRGQLVGIVTNSGSSPLRLANRCARIGIQIDCAQIYSAAACVCDYALRTYARPNHRPRLYNCATEAMEEMLDGVVDWVTTGGEPCDAVLIASPTSTRCTHDRQRVALQLARGGAQLLGLCADRVFPSRRGLEFGAGALTHMLAYASNREPIFCGKPQDVFFNEFCRHLSVRPNECVLIGDNLEADIAGARAVGMHTILTLTGVTTRRDLLAAPPTWSPHHIVDDLTQVF